MLLLLFLAELLPAEPIRLNLQHSYETGALQRADWLWQNQDIGFNQYNDCLLVMMERFRRDPWSSAVAPVVVFNDLPGGPLLRQPLTECEIARAAVQSPQPRRLFRPDRFFEYSRYVHAYRIPFILLISVVSVGVIRILYRVTVAGILLFLFLRHVRRFCLSQISTERVTAICFVVITLAFLLFSGLDIFSQSLTHGPSDMLLFASFGWLSLASGRRVLAQGGVTAALSSLAFGFDFLHGTVPQMLAILIGCTALRSYAESSPLAVSFFLKMVLAFAFGVAGAVLAKLLAASSIGGWATITDFGDQLLFRINGGEHSYRQVFSNLYWASSQIGFGHYWPPVVAIACGIAGALFAFALLLNGSVQRRDRLALTAMLASAMVPFGWYIIFKNHASIHGFMVRLLAWPIGLCLTSLIVAVASVRHAHIERSSNAPYAEKS